MRTFRLLFCLEKARDIMKTQREMDTIGAGVTACSHDNGSRQSGVFGKLARFTFGLAVFWVLVFVVLPLGQRLPLIKPVMEIIVESGVDAGAYFYTQSEETAYAVMYVNHTVNGVKKPSETTESTEKKGF